MIVLIDQDRAGQNNTDSESGTRMLFSFRRISEFRIDLFVTEGDRARSKLVNSENQLDPEAVGKKLMSDIM